MIRVIIENLLLFMLPTLAYVAFVLVRRDGGSGEARGQPQDVHTMLDDAPLLWLFAAGTVLVIVTLVISGWSSGGKPGQTYHPPIVKDGRVVPGHID